MIGQSYRLRAVAIKAEQMEDGRGKIIYVYAFPGRKQLKKPLLPLFGAALVLLIVALGCTTPDFRAFTNPVMTTKLMQAEMERLHQINQNVANGDFDPSDYPVSVGIDVRNGKMLVEKFICWDACPNVGMVFLLYRGVETEAACADALVGLPLISPDPIPGQYWGCRPVVDWLDTPGMFPD